MSCYRVGMRRLLVLLLLSGCYASHSPSEEERRAYVGDYCVSAATGWALLHTLTRYRFHADGEIEIVEHAEGDYFEGEAGKWSTGPGREICEFGDRWWTVDGLLYVESECGDELVPLVMRYLGEANALGCSDSLGIVAPHGATGFWEEPRFGGIGACEAVCGR